MRRPFLSEERSRLFAEEIVARRAREKECLVAHFMHQHPDVPIEDVILSETRRGQTTTWQVRQRRRQPKTEGTRHG